MKNATITTFGLMLALLLVVKLQATEGSPPMGKGDGLVTSRTMQDSDQGTASGDMNLKHAAKSMQAETLPMKTGAMMKQDDKTMQRDTMKEAQPMIPNDAELRQRLTPLQYRVTRENGTEPPFKNTYWDNHEPGIYVDIISGVPLFSSTDKYDSGTGWPSFTRPLDPAAVVEKEDRSFFSVRTEIRGKLSDAHLGHVFTDGPPPTGLRYCMNSAALRFIPKTDLVQEGYGEYEKLFK
jgi:methionine-R-sulfoxide reductase